MCAFSIVLWSHGFCVNKNQVRLPVSQFTSWPNRREQKETTSLKHCGIFSPKEKKNCGGICEPGWGILTWKMCMRKDALVFILVSRCMAASCHSGGLHRFLSRSDCSFSLSLQVPKSPLKYICCDTPQPKIHTHDRVKPHHSNRAKQLTKSGISFILSPTSDFNQPFQWSQFVTRWTCLLSLGLRLLTQSA